MIFAHIVTINFGNLNKTLGTFIIFLFFFYKKAFVSSFYVLISIFLYEYLNNTFIRFPNGVFIHSVAYPDLVWDSNGMSLLAFAFVL